MKKITIIPLPLSLIELKKKTYFPSSLRKEKSRLRKKL